METTDTASPAFPPTDATDPAAAPAGKPNLLIRAWRGYEAGLGRLVAAVSAAYRALGMWTYSKPVLLLAITFAITIGACVGWVRFRQENSSDVLCECSVPLCPVRGPAPPPPSGCPPLRGP